MTSFMELSPLWCLIVFYVNIVCRYCLILAERKITNFRTLVPVSSSGADRASHKKFCYAYIVVTSFVTACMKYYLVITILQAKCGYPVCSCIISSIHWDSVVINDEPVVAMNNDYFSVRVYSHFKHSCRK